MLVQLDENDRVYWRLEALEQKKDIVLPSYFKEYRTVAKTLESKVTQQVETDQQNIENTGADIMWTSKKQALLARKDKVTNDVNSAKRRRNSTLAVPASYSDTLTPKKRVGSRHEAHLLPEIANSGFQHLRVPS